MISISGFPWTDTYKIPTVDVLKQPVEGSVKKGVYKAFAKFSGKHLR